MKSAAEKLKAMTPPPMNSMLEKESRTDAVQKRVDRSKRTVEDVPPTTTGKEDLLTIPAALKIRDTLIIGVMFPCLLSWSANGKLCLIQRTENMGTYCMSQ